MLFVVGGDEMRDGMAEARMLLSARRYEDARRLAYTCSAENPGDPSPLLLAARAELASGDARQAEGSASHAVGLDPLSAEGHRVLSRIILSQALKQRDIFRLDLAAKALRSAHEALRLAPSDIDALLAVAEAAAWARQFPEAVAAVDEAVRLLPSNEHVWFVRARVARLARDLPVAEASAREALRIVPGFYAASNELGLILSAKRDRVGAREQFVAAAIIDPLARPARLNLLNRIGWWVYPLCLLFTSPILLLATIMKRPQAAFLAWLLVGTLLRGALLRWPPLSHWLQRRAVAQANKVAGRPRRRRRSQRPDPSPAAPIRSRHQLPTWMLVMWTVIIVPIAVGVSIVSISSPSPAAMAVPDLAGVACIVGLVRRLRRRKPRRQDSQTGEAWQTTR
jgi:tetratricopeptide (TPR) repeat protein